MRQKHNDYRNNTEQRQNTTDLERVELQQEWMYELKRVFHLKLNYAHEDFRFKAWFFVYLGIFYGIEVSSIEKKSQKSHCFDCNF